MRLTVPVIAGPTYTVLHRSAAADGSWQVLQHLDAIRCDCDVGVDGSPAPGGTRFYPGGDAPAAVTGRAVPASFVRLRRGPAVL